jgi:RHS repeat-associated protein
MPSADVTSVRDISRRGFTDHEHLGNTKLIHMNGRVYDPLLARFVSADPFIDGITNTQGWNRYSYVGNNPLSYTDPSGYAGVPRSPDDPPEGTPDNPLSCTGWGFSLYCDPAQHVDNVRRNDRGPTALTFEQVLELLERRFLQQAGTKNFSPQLGEAGGEDFGSSNDAIAEDLKRGSAAHGFDDWKVIAPFLLWFDIEDYAIRHAPQQSQEALRAVNYLLGAKSLGRDVIRGGPIVIGKLNDLRRLSPGEKSLLSRLPNRGSPKANWAQNSGVLRQEMGHGRPIRDASVDRSGALINDTGFLRAERNLLRTQGWTYDPTTTMWYPPGY